MKTLPILVLLAAAGWLGSVALRAGDADYKPEVLEVPHQLSAELPVGFVDRTISIDGMCGPCCERNLFDRVRAVEGVEAAAVSFNDESVTVRVREDNDVQAVIEALTTDQHTPSLEL